MTSPSGLQIPIELAYTRNVAFAVELLDPMTMERVSDGITVEAIGLRRKVIRNELGLFIWVNEDPVGLSKLSIRTGSNPYESVELTPAQLRLPPKPSPLTTIQLAPAVSYAFARGVTGMRGTLIEDAASRTAIANAEVHLRWLADDDGNTWRDSPIYTHTTRRGDFVSVLRLAPTDVPLLDANGAVTVRLRVLRDGMLERGSGDLKLPQGRVVDSTSIPALTFAWDALQP